MSESYSELYIRYFHISMHILADDFQNTILTEGEFFTKEDGLRYLRLLDIDAHPKIGDMIIKANGIFPDPELGRFIKISS